MPKINISMGRAFMMIIGILGECLVCEHGKMLMLDETTNLHLPNVTSLGGGPSHIS